MMADDDAPTCPIDGNSDLYGLGVRLGLYLQFLALVLARPSATRAFDSINTSTIAFILSNFVVLIQQTSSRELYAPEAYLLFYLLVPQLVVNVLGTSLKPGALDYRGFIAILLWGAFCFYYSWFWWVGLDVLKRSTCDDEFGFFFTNVSLRGWFRTFNKAIWTIANIAFGMSILLMVARYIKHFFRARDASPKPKPTENKADSKIATLGDIVQHIYLQFWSLIPFAVFVSGAEVTLRYNNIQGVNTVHSASQLVPLVLALGLLVDVIIKTLRKLSHGFRHAFDEEIEAEEHLARADGGDQNPAQDSFRQELLQETGWFGIIGRFLFRVYRAFAVGYNNEAEKEEEELNQSGSVTGCPKRGQYASVDVELQGGTRP